jgi:hypothetical protein
MVVLRLIHSEVCNFRQGVRTHFHRLRRRFKGAKFNDCILIRAKSDRTWRFIFPMFEMQYPQSKQKKLMLESREVTSLDGEALDIFDLCHWAASRGIDLQTGHFFRKKLPELRLVAA